MHPNCWMVVKTASKRKGESEQLSDYRLLLGMTHTINLCTQQNVGWLLLQLSTSEKQSTTEHLADNGLKLFLEQHSYFYLQIWNSLWTNFLALWVWKVVADWNDTHSEFGMTNSRRLAAATAIIGHRETINKTEQHNSLM